MATLNTGWTGVGLGGALSPTCKTSTAGSNPALASTFSNSHSPVPLVHVEASWVSSILIHPRQIRGLCQPFAGLAQAVDEVERFPPWNRPVEHDVALCALGLPEDCGHPGAAGVRVMDQQLLAV